MEEPTAAPMNNDGANTPPTSPEPAAMDVTNTAPRHTQAHPTPLSRGGQRTNRRIYGGPDEGGRSKVAMHTGGRGRIAGAPTPTPPNSMLPRGALGSAGAHAPCWEWPGTAWPCTGFCFAAAPLTTPRAPGPLAYTHSRRSRLVETAGHGVGLSPLVPAMTSKVPAAASE